MRSFLPILLCIFFFSRSSAQDTVYARKVIRFLTSKSCFGRGYVKNGLAVAAGYIVSEIKKSNAQPLFGESYLQPFRFNVNTFPGKMKLRIDGHELKPGVDFIVDPSCGSYKGTVKLYREDSTLYASHGADLVSLSLKRKLTFSVSDHAEGCKIQLLNTAAYGKELTAAIHIESKVEAGFLSNNIGAFFPGTRNSDSMIVFSAHYDHLGGMGKGTFFPGANDNASGTSMVLDLIRYYKAHPPAYKTVFLFFAGEEAGLLGSRHFVQQSLDGASGFDLHRIKFLVNLDLLGTGDDGIMVVNGAVFQKEFETLLRLNREQELIKEIRKRGKASSSDHYWFYEAGVPCFFIYTMGGIKAYHDVYDLEKTLPLTDYGDVFRLLTAFVQQF